MFIFSPVPLLAGNSNIREPYSPPSVMNYRKIDKNSEITKTIIHSLNGINLSMEITSGPVGNFTSKVFSDLDST